MRVATVLSWKPLHIIGEHQVLDQMVQGMSSRGNGLRMDRAENEERQ